MEDDERKRLNNLRQNMAALDGKRGYGGCEYCDASYEFKTISLGRSDLLVWHVPGCPKFVSDYSEIFDD